MFPDTIALASSSEVCSTCLRLAKVGGGQEGERGRGGGERGGGGGRGGEESLRRRSSVNHHRGYRVILVRNGRTSRGQRRGWMSGEGTTSGRGFLAGHVSRCPGVQTVAATGHCSRRKSLGAFSSSGGRAEMEADMHLDDSAAATSAPVLDDVPHLSNWLPNLPTYPNPLNADPAYRAARSWFIEDNEVVARQVVVRLSREMHNQATFFRRAGPRERIAFKPEEVVAGIVTCGGLCPGLNTVIRELVCVLWTQYCVRNILGIEGGYRGFYARNTIPLNPKNVNDIHKRGGTILGTSRGGHEVTKIVNSIEDRGMNQVYIIGGDGTQRGADVIHREIVRRGLKVAVAGIPKTIDNDIAVIDRSFGFDTAVEEAQRAINAAHVEAQSVQNGVGVVKLMGRYSGYISMHASLASRDVDCCLIPELPFYLEGKGGLYEFVEKRLLENGHMVIVVAEGAGQELIARSANEVVKSDESGNRLLLDVGMWLSSQIKSFWERNKKGPLNIKYIDPTYMVRAVPSNASDSVYCTLLAHSAVHGAMAGYTGFVAGPVNGRHAYIPIGCVTEKQNRVNVHDRMWARLLSSTNQPDFMRYKQILDEKRRLRECEAGRLDRCLQTAATAAATEAVENGDENESGDISDTGNGSGSGNGIRRI